MTSLISSVDVVMYNACSFVDEYAQDFVTYNIFGAVVNTSSHCLQKQVFQVLARNECNLALERVLGYLAGDSFSLIAK